MVVKEDGLASLFSNHKLPFNWDDISRFLPSMSENTDLSPSTPSKVFFSKWSGNSGWRFTTGNQACNASCQNTLWQSDVLFTEESCSRCKETCRGAYYWSEIRQCAVIFCVLMKSRDLYGCWRVNSASHTLLYSTSSSSSLYLLLCSSLLIVPGLCLNAALSSLFLSVRSVRR